MTEIAWATIRDQAIEQFAGQTPRAEDEDRIIDHFEHQPTIVIQAIAELAQAQAVKWKWSALAARLDRATEPSRNPTVQTGPNKAKQVEKADAWTRNAGFMFDRWSEVQDELFGDRGILHPWRHQTKLVDRMQQAWEDIRPTGIQTEHEETERADRWKNTRAAVLAKPRTNEPTDPEPDLPPLETYAALEPDPEPT